MSYDLLFLRSGPVAKLAKATVCKTVIRRFESGSGLVFLSHHIPNYLWIMSNALFTHGNLPRSPLFRLAMLLLLMSLSTTFLVATVWSSTEATKIENVLKIERDPQRKEVNSPPIDLTFIATLASTISAHSHLLGRVSTICLHCFVPQYSDVLLIASISSPRSPPVIGIG